MNDANPSSTRADTNVVICKSLEESTEKCLYKEAIGSLFCLSSVSRPDISFGVNMLSRYVNHPSQQHLNAIKRIIRYLINTKHVCIKYEEKSKLILRFSFRR